MGDRLYELGLQARSRQFESSGKLEVRWADHKAHKQTRRTVKDLRALCKAYNGNREYMVVVVLQMGTVYTNVQVTGNPERFSGLCYPCKAMGTVTNGTQGTFRYTQVREFYLAPKNATITRR
jgi:hypothetical protein